MDLHAVFVVPRGVSAEKEALMAALGGEIVHVPAENGMAGAIETARAIAERGDDAIVPQQFATPLNVEAHYEMTGPEILDALDGEVGAGVAGVGSGGTLMGVVGAVAEVVPDVRVVAVEPEGSTSGELIGDDRTEAPYKTEGIGTHEPEVAELLDPDVLDEIVAVPVRAAHTEAQRLAAEEGHLVGSSAGAASIAARRTTEAIDAGQLTDPDTGAVMTQIYATSTFEQDASGEHRIYWNCRFSTYLRNAMLSQ